MMENEWLAAGDTGEVRCELDSMAAESPAGSHADALLEFRDTVFLICLGYVRNRWDAEDLAQETYLRAHLRFSELREAAQARAWISRIARNACLDHLRRARVRRLFGLSWRRDESAVPRPDITFEEQERIQALGTAMSALPARLRDVLVMREYGELQYEEIAKALGLRTGTVMSRLHRARNALAKMLMGART